jgi:ribosome-associated protein YbcJ (S4-like RNA binding protein)
MVNPEDPTDLLQNLDCLLLPGEGKAFVQEVAVRLCGLCDNRHVAKVPENQIIITLSRQ